jgi:sensor histidine kinase YesM
MKKFIALMVFSCSLYNSYSQSTTSDSKLLPDSQKTTNISFHTRIDAPDLQIKSLTAFPDKDQIVFTLTYKSKKDRFLSLFNPPNGDALKYFDWDGININDTITTFSILKDDFKSVDEITMRFSIYNSKDADRNFIILELNNPAVRKLLGLSHHNSFYSKIFPFYSSLINIIAMWLMIPILLFIGNKVSAYVSPIEKWISNKCLSFNIEVIIASMVVISILFVIAVIAKNTISLKVGLFLLAIPILPANLVYISEKMLFKSKKMFWIRQYLNLFFIIVGLFFSYNFFNEISGRVLGRASISLDNIILFGILVGFVRLINNYLLYHNITSLKEKELEIARLSELKTRSDLNALQSKINPHFLYNSLNSIAELCQDNPQKAESMALSLSKLFRYSINKEENDFNQLKNEIEIVSLYLNIEKERFGNKLEYEFNYSSTIENILIPKFILQPLIENAIKHGIAKNPNGGLIKLMIAKKDNELRIVVYDNGPDFLVDLNSGYGLKSIYDKLDIFYPNRYTIEMHNGVEKNITLILKDGI